MYEYIWNTNDNIIIIRFNCINNKQHKKITAPVFAKTVAVI